MSTQVKVKVCGMRDSSNVLAVAALTPDYMGFIHYPPSPRYVGKDFLTPSGIPASIEKVGVFVNDATDNIIRALEKNKMTMAQLHGEESPEQCAELRSKGIRVIKAFALSERFDFAETRQYEHEVDYFLFDTKGRLYGGNARQFKWEVLEGYDQRVPFFLSGGLNIGNLKSLSRLKGMNLHAVDLNSGVEVSAGIKDVEMIRDVMTQLEQE